MKRKTKPAQNALVLYFLLVSATVLAATHVTIAAALLTIAASRLTTAAGRPMITVIIIQMSWSKAQDDTLDLLR